MKIQINTMIQGDTLEVLKTLPDESVSMVMTSPPYYGLRDYGTAKWEGGNPECDHKIPSNEYDTKRAESSHKSRFIREICYKCGAKRIDSQIGLEKTPEEYIAKMRKIMLEIKRVLRKDGTVWWNIGDTYSGGGGGNYGSGISTACGNTKHPTNIRNKPSFTEKYQAKSLLMMPERFAFMMLDIGFILRNKIIWHKPNPMPSSVKDRFTTTWEYVYLFSKNKKYYFDLDAVREPHKWASRDKRSKLGRVEHKSGKNPGDMMEIMVDKKRKSWFSNPGHDKTHTRQYEKGKDGADFWNICTKPYKGAHFAVYPEALCETPIKAGCPEWICNKCGKPRERIVKKIDEPHEWSDCGCNAGFKAGIVLDPFCGSGTTLAVAKKLGRNYIGIELNPEYIKLAESRLGSIQDSIGKFIENGVVVD